MKGWFCAAVGVVGTTLSLFLGGYDTALIVLAVLMGIDWFSGVMLAAVFKKSPKTDTGTANSAIGFKGICKKFYMLLLVGVANSLDTVLATNFCRTGLIFAFVANETLSIVENAGLMGIPIPPVIRKAIDVLIKRSETNES